MSSEKAKYLSLSEWCFNTLKKAILRGELKAGQTLKEIEISKKLHVSRSPVREAIQHLVHEGLAEMTPHKGASIVIFNKNDVIHLMRVRKALESLVVEELCNSSIDFKMIDHCKTSLKTLLKGEKKSERYPQEYFDFHDYLVKQIKNRFLVDTINIISNKIKILRFQADVFDGRKSSAIKEHLKIIEAIEKHNKELAILLTNKHIEISTENIIKGRFINENGLKR